MATPPMPPHRSSPTGAAVAGAERQAAAKLERQLKSLATKKSFYDPEVRALRAQLRASFARVLLEDLEVAAAADVEGLMWKLCCYRPIEEFRQRLRQAEKAGAEGAAQVPKVAAAFSKFLDDVSGFYRALVAALQARYGDVRVDLQPPPGLDVRQPPLPAALAAAAAAAAAEGDPSAPAAGAAQPPRDVRPNVARCLVFLGDASRYQAQAAPGAGGGAGAAQAAWARAMALYRLAARTYPPSGHPWNQVAVMAAMRGDELRAAGGYARAIGAPLPFPTARENLLLLLEGNRGRVAQLPPGSLPPGADAAAAASRLGARWVRLVGLLYDRINLEGWAAALAAARDALQALLSHPGAGALLAAQGRSDGAPLHLALLSAFGVHCADGTLHAQAGGRAPGAGATFAESLQRLAMRSRGTAAACTCGAALFAAAAQWAPGAPGRPALLAGAHVLLRWMAVQPEYVLPPSAGACSADEALARTRCWEAAGQLAAALAREVGAAAARGATSGAASSEAAAWGVLHAEEGLLVEDREVLGFEPISGPLGWKGAASMAAAAEPEDPSLRPRRCLQALAAVAAALQRAPAADGAARAPAAAPVLADAAAPAQLEALAAAQRAFVAVVAASAFGDDEGGLTGAQPGVPVGAAAVAAGVVGSGGRAPAGEGGTADEGGPEAMEADAGGEAGAEGEDDEEEVIVFRPQPPRAPSPVAAEAPVASGPARGAQPPQQRRQQQATGAPGAGGGGRAVAAHTNHGATAAEALAAPPAGTGAAAAPFAAKPSAPIAAPAAAPPTEAPLLAGMAATAYDRQQAAAASTMLLARLQRNAPAPEPPPLPQPFAAAASSGGGFGTLATAAQLEHTAAWAHAAAAAAAAAAAPAQPPPYAPYAAADPPQLPPPPPAAAAAAQPLSIPTARVSELPAPSPEGGSGAMGLLEATAHAAAASVLSPPKGASVVGLAGLLEAQRPRAGGVDPYGGGFGDWLAATARAEPPPPPPLHGALGGSGGGGGGGGLFTAATVLAAGRGEPPQPPLHGALGGSGGGLFTAASVLAASRSGGGGGAAGAPLAAAAPGSGGWSAFGGPDLFDGVAAPLRRASHSGSGFLGGPGGALPDSPMSAASGAAAADAAAAGVAGRSNGHSVFDSPREEQRRGEWGGAGNLSVLGRGPPPPTPWAAAHGMGGGGDVSGGEATARALHGFGQQQFDQYTRQQSAASEGELARLLPLTLQHQHAWGEGAVAFPGQPLQVHSEDAAALPALFAAGGGVRPPRNAQHSANPFQ